MEFGIQSSASITFPTGKATKTPQCLSDGSCIATNTFSSTATYSYKSISINGVSLGATRQKVYETTITATKATCIYYASYSNGTLTLQQYVSVPVSSTVTSAIVLGNAYSTTLVGTTDVSDIVVNGTTNLKKVYARQGETGTYVLVFEKGGTVTMALWFGGNWKMNKVKSEIDEFFTAFNSALTLDTNKKVVIFPPICYLDYVKSKIIASGLSSMVSLGAQNISAYEKGAYTGQISAQQVADCGCTYAMVGSYEVRGYLGATDADVNNAVGVAFSNGLKVVLCVGEDLTARNGGTYATYVKNQLQTDLSGIETSSVENGGLIIVYEPVWAIGTGKTITTNQIHDMITNIIRPKITELYGTEVANEMVIAMGGTVNAKTIQGYITEGTANGGLAAAASLKGDTFASIINTTTA